jgi:hypothetical protein
MQASPEQTLVGVHDRRLRARTDVTESFELRDQPLIRLYWVLLGWARRKTNVENMRTTLQRMKATVEAS